MGLFFLKLNELCWVFFKLALCVLVVGSGGFGLQLLSSTRVLG